MEGLLPRVELQILTAWLAIFIAVAGWGTLTRLAGHRLLGRVVADPEPHPDPSADLLLSSFWIGFAVLLLALQLWHFVFPVDVRATLGVAAIGIAGTLLGGVRPWTPLLRAARSPRAWLGMVLWCAALLWLSNRALIGPRHGDSGAYFVPTVRWYASYPVVPGLGNLYPLFAYNQSYFRWVALLEAGPLPGCGVHLANSVLLVVLATRVFLGLARLVAGRGRCSTSDVFYACMLPLAGYLASGILFTSPSPDFAVYLLGIALFAPLLPLGRRDAPAAERARGLLSVALLAIAGVTIKLSLAALGAGVLLVGSILWMRDRPHRMRDAPRLLVAIAALAVVGIGSWIIGNVLQSGCPLFPSTLGALPVEWRTERDVAAWIRSIEIPLDPALAWRDPRGALRALGNRGWSEPAVLIPALVAPGCFLAALAGRIALRRRVAAPGFSVWTLVPTLGALGASLCLAAAPRFAGALPWVVVAQGVLLAFGSLLTGAGRAPRLVLSSLLITAMAALLAPDASLWSPMHQLSPSVVPACDTHRLASGLEVLVPRSGQTCWGAPLPCTTELDPRLALRRPGDLRWGFVLTRPEAGGDPQAPPR